MSHSQQYEASELAYQVDFRPQTRETVQHRRANSTRRRRTAPQSFNGIHRRRRKKFAW